MKPANGVRCPACRKVAPWMHAAPPLTHGGERSRCMHCDVMSPTKWWRLVAERSLRRPGRRPRQSV